MRRSPDRTPIGPFASHATANPRPATSMGPAVPPLLSRAETASAYPEAAQTTPAARKMSVRSRRPVTQARGESARTSTPIAPARAS